MDIPSDVVDRALGRRNLLRAGAGALAALGGTRVVRHASASDGTPQATDEKNLAGQYGVTRTYVVAEDADLDALIAIVEEYAALIAASPGFDAYTILYSDETRIWTAMAIFDTAEHAQTSTESAAAFVQEHDLASYFEEPSPVVVEGRVLIERGV